jgi:hypothetical protein
MDQTNYDYWFKRGVEDFLKDRPVLFEKKKYGVIPRGECDWTEEELVFQGGAYLDGYESVGY